MKPLMVNVSGSKSSMKDCPCYVIVVVSWGIPISFALINLKIYHRIQRCQMGHGCKLALVTEDPKRIFRSLFGSGKLLMGNKEVAGNDKGFTGVNKSWSKFLNDMFTLNDKE